MNKSRILKNAVWLGSTLFCSSGLVMSLYFDDILALAGFTAGLGLAYALTAALSKLDAAEADVCFWRVEFAKAQERYAAAPCGDETDEKEEAGEKPAEEDAYTLKERHA